MSCVGKTTFAHQLCEQGRPSYLCFDSLYPWHCIETLGLSISAALRTVAEVCEGHESFVLDGWNLADADGDYLPKQSSVYVVYAPYDQIIGQYRVPVPRFEQHLPMYKRWYGIDLSRFSRCYWRSMPGKHFVETTEDEFQACCKT